MDYRMKVPIIEAFQMREDRRWDNSEWPSWLNQAWNLEWSDQGSVYPDPTHQETLMFAGAVIEWDDWLVKNQLGHLFLMTNENFGELFETADPNDQSFSIPDGEIHEVVSGLLSSLGMVIKTANELGGDFLAPHHMKWGVKGLTLLEKISDEESASTAEGMASVQDGGSRMDIDAEGGDPSGQGEDPSPAA